MSKKIVNSDIYNLTELVDDIKKEYIPEDNEDTLNIGIYGSIGAIEAKRLQSQVIMTGELCNESFPARARLERNVIMHAITYNIPDINAVPATIDIRLGIRQNDINEIMKNDIFIIDRECPIYIDKYEFHLDYDIILKKISIANNEQVYTAQYDMKRNNPASDIVNPYLTAPAVINIDGIDYLFINASISQVIHNIENKKIITSNIIDNKIINFEFNEDEQLAYFEIHITESSNDIYLTPIFEGSGIPNDVIYYCWYQYIDTNKIRVRFDRNSYMPGLNANIDVLYKTTYGLDGNFEYTKDSFINLESSIYGYRNISILLSPLSKSGGGKNKKSKSELQALLPKEALARGSLTTIKDLNNYFGMLDTSYGRMIVQKKIDNQIERTYYTYLVLKDIEDNIIPTNTIDLIIPKNQLIDSKVNTSDSSRYVLNSGSQIPYVKYTDISFDYKDFDRYKSSITDNIKGLFSESEKKSGYPVGIVGYRNLYEKINKVHSILIEKNETFKTAKLKFSEIVTDTNTIPSVELKFIQGKGVYNYGLLEIKDLIEGVYPLFSKVEVCNNKTIDNSQYNKSINNKSYPVPIITRGLSKIENVEYNTSCMLGIGSSIRLSIEGIAEKSGEVIYTLSGLEGFLLSRSQSVSFYNNNNGKWELDSTYEFSSLDGVDFELNESLHTIMHKFNIPKNGMKFIFELILTSNVSTMKPYTHIEGTLQNNEKSTTTDVCNICSLIPRITSDIEKTEYIPGDRIDYEIDFAIDEKNTNIEMLIGTIYGMKLDESSIKIEYPGKDPVEKIAIDITDSIRELNKLSSSYNPTLGKDIYRNYLYSNPYSIVINFHTMYSTFYMMYVNTNPYVHFDYVNQKSAAQFIASTIQWKRPFLGPNKNKYTLKMDITQSIAKDIGLILREDINHPEKITGVNVRMIAVFYKNKKAYRYKELNIDTVDEDTYTYGYNISLESTDQLDSDNDIRINGVGVSGQDVEDYGYFNSNTVTKIFILTKLQNIGGGYSLNGLDLIVPGLNGWNVTNIFNIENGLDFYYNYSNIMGSRVIPYGKKVSDDSMEIEGYYIKGVPVFGYDYCQNDFLIDRAMQSLNNKKIYIDDAITKLENSFGVDFKFFNTYGPSNTFYVITDDNYNNYLDDGIEFINAVDITMNFRIKLVSSADNYTKNLIIKDIKNYIEDLNELKALHIPTLITQITNSYKESISYIEFLGFNNYGPGVQHIYKLEDNEIPIHTCPEFINVHNYKGVDGKIYPNINIYLEGSGFNKNIKVRP